MVNGTPAGMGYYNGQTELQCNRVRIQYAPVEVKTRNYINKCLHRIANSPFVVMLLLSKSRSTSQLGQYSTIEKIKYPISRSIFNNFQQCKAQW